MKVDIFNSNKKYNIIYADPPWNFNSKELQKYKGKRFRPLEEVYQTEKTSDMKEWNIKRITEKDCAIFMWTTDAHIKEAIELFEHAVENNSHYTLAYFNLGRAYAILKENTKAAKYFQQALDLNAITNDLDDEDIRYRLYKLFEV